MEMKCTTTIPVGDLLDYLESEQNEWEGKNADRYWQTARIMGFVQTLGLAETVRKAECEHIVVNDRYLGLHCKLCNRDFGCGEASDVQAEPTKEET